MQMVWGIVIGLVVGGFVGLFSQVATFAMWNLWLFTFAGGLLGGVCGWIVDKWRNRRSAAS